MALVAYSDSEPSEAEPETTPALTDKTKKPDASSTNFHIDRTNPRKIRVALPELKPENSADQDTDDGPARKKARLGGGTGGTFSSFNALLPAPKRAAEKPATVASTRKVFSLKTGATPGFDRQADAEMKRDQALDTTVDDDRDVDGNAVSAAASLGKTADEQVAPAEKKTDTGPVKLQGNPIMFRPLSVGRTAQKKKTTKPTPPQPTPTSSTAAASQPSEASTVATEIPSKPAPPVSKPKVNLFSLSSETTALADTPPAVSTTYEPLVYNTSNEKPAEGPVAAVSTSTVTTEDSSAESSNPTSLDTIANDLNLSRSERRQLFGRHAPPAQSRVLTFNTDKEYASNQALAQTELAAAEHKPVRAIAPGKHTLQQLVNAASSQREALEESFAAGKRNKKEAGSKYGW